MSKAKKLLEELVETYRYSVLVDSVSRNKHEYVGKAITRLPEEKREILRELKSNEISPKVLRLDIV